MTGITVRTVSIVSAVMRVVSTVWRCTKRTALSTNTSRTVVVDAYKTIASHPTSYSTVTPEQGKPCSWAWSLR